MSARDGKINDLIYNWVNSIILYKLRYYSIHANGFLGKISSYKGLHRRKEIQKTREYAVLNGIRSPKWNKQSKTEYQNGSLKIVFVAKPS